MAACWQSWSRGFGEDIGTPQVFPYYLETGRVIYLPNTWNGMTAIDKLQWIQSSNLSPADAGQLETESGIDNGAYLDQAVGAVYGTAAIAAANAAQPGTVGVNLGVNVGGGDGGSNPDDTWLNRNVIFPLFNNTSAVARDTYDAAAKAGAGLKDIGLPLGAGFGIGTVLALGVGGLLLYAYLGGGAKRR